MYKEMGFIVPVTILATMLVVADSCPVVTSVNGSCCDIRSNEFHFSSKPVPRVYNITNFCGECGLVAEGYCDTITDGGGWLVIQRRQDENVVFNRTWADYEDGFGSLMGDFWYGLRAMHCITNERQWELRIDYVTVDGIKGYLSYSNFKVGPGHEQYPLTASGYKGTTADPFNHQSHNGMKFTTIDRDNDRWAPGNCAKDNWAGSQAGGWWYNTCASMHLNNRPKTHLLISLNNKWVRQNFVEMKIRPKNCRI